MTDRHKFKSPTKKRSEEIISTVYEYLKQHGETLQHDLAQIVGCASSSVGSSKLMLFNQWARENKMTHLFRIDNATAGKRTSWRIVER
jgi:hypothetical protein